MKIFLILIIFLTGCEKDVYFSTETTPLYNISITYPITGNIFIDEEIKSYVGNIYENFIIQEQGFFKNELNISYLYTKDSLVLNTHTNISGRKEDIEKVFLLDNAIMDSDLGKVYDVDYTVSEVIYDKVIALTFDDGPSKYTESIVNLLNEYNSKATFFMVGNKINQYEDLIYEMINDGHEIGNHTYDHKWLTRLSKEEMLLQINKSSDLFLEKYNYQLNYLRPTYGSLNNILKENSPLEIVMWTVDSSDWKIKDSEILYTNIINEVENYDIVLFHDTYESTYNALLKIIPKLIDEGYQLVTISELKQNK